MITYDAKFVNNQAVIALVGETTFHGKIIGIVNANTFMPSYIVRCTDSFIPNDVYRFSATVVTEDHIRDLYDPDWGV